MRIVEYQSDFKYDPPKMGCDNLLSKQIKDPLPNKMCPFFAFVGSPGSGKSSLAISLLTNPDAYHKVFQNIYVCMPPNSRESIKGNIFRKLPDEQVFDKLTPQVLEQVKESCETESNLGHYTLLFIDDCQQELKQKDVQALLEPLVANRRHLKLHIWIMVQNYNKMPLNTRKAISNAAIFKSRNKKELSLLMSEIMQFSNEEIDVLAKHIYKDPFGFMFIDTNSGKVFNKFNEIEILE